MPSIDLQAAESPWVLAIDIGTSSVRALLFDRKGRDIRDSEAQIAYDITITPDGGIETDARLLFGLVEHCIDGVLANAGSRAGTIGAVGVACFWHSLLGLDGDGEPVTPVLFYSDTRSAEDVTALRTELDGPTVHARVGTVLHSSYWPGKLRWLSRTRPGEIARVRRWCAFSDYLLRRLHGFDGTSVSMASGTGMLDARRIIWDEELVRASGVDPQSMPTIHPQTTVLQSLDVSHSGRWPRLAAVPWFLGLGDGACANVGCGATGRGRIALTIGTTGAMRIVVPSGRNEPIDISPDLWCYRLDEHRVVLGAAISNGGKLLAWVNDLLGTEFGDEATLVAEAMSPDAHGLTLLPFLAGERSPIWNDRATGVIAGLTLNSGRPQVIRAAMESVALRFARLHPSLARVAAADHEIVTNGAGILRNAAWLHMHADALQRPLRTLPPEEESTARGAAVMALASAGIVADIDDVVDPVATAGTVEPYPDHADAYQRAVARQFELERLLFSDRAAWDDDL